jgi:hypothetical protein
MMANESRRHLIKLFGSECDVDDEILVYLELLEVVIELADNLISRCVGEDWLRQAVVQCPAVQRQEQAVFNRCEGRERDSHRLGPPSPPLSRHASLGASYSVSAASAADATSEY